MTNTPSGLGELLESDVRAARDRGLSAVSEPVGKSWLRRVGISVPTGVLLAREGTTEELAAQLTDLAAPYVLKAVATGLVHKSDVGGVVVGVGEQELAGELLGLRQRIAAANYPLEAVLVEQLAPAGLELAIGAVRDESDRFIVMIGLGGVLVELIHDVAFGVAPLSRLDIEQMVSELRGCGLLSGFRGSAPLDRAALVDAIYAFAGPDGLVLNLPSAVAEVDINPVILTEHGLQAVDVRVLLRDEPPSPPHRHHGEFAAGAGARLLEPTTIAVLGASRTRTSPANLFIRNAQAFGFAGAIVPVHPDAKTIEGLPAISSLAELTGPIDYAFVSLPAASVSGALEQATHPVAFVQVVSGGFSEVDGGAELSASLRDTVRRKQMRLIGPNSLGAHSSRARMTFVDDAPSSTGAVAVISQSGGLSVEILRQGTARGVQFANVISIGNAEDVSVSELLHWCLSSAEIEIIGIYLESVTQGIELLEFVRGRPLTKPVVLLAGGRSSVGAKAALSHTGALTRTYPAWETLSRQAGLVLVDSLNEFLIALYTLQIADSACTQAGTELILFGNGGGAGVLAADDVARHGMTLAGLSAEETAGLTALELPPGTSVANPIDLPAWTLMAHDGKFTVQVLDVLTGSRGAVAVIVHFNLGILLSNADDAGQDIVTTLVEGVANCLDDSPSTHILLVLKSDGRAPTEQRSASVRALAQSRGLPVYQSINDAIVGAKCLSRWREVRERTATAGSEPTNEETSYA